MDGNWKVIEELQAELAKAKQASSMTEKQQLLAMLDRAGIGYGLGDNYTKGTEEVHVESDESDGDGSWWVTNFEFDATGKLQTVVTYEGEEG